MPTGTYDLVMVGGGLSAMLFLTRLRGSLPARVAVVDPTLPAERPTVHWSYWSPVATPYDRFAVGAWRRARAGGRPAEDIAPYSLRLVRSTDVLLDLFGALSAVPVEWLRAETQSVFRIRRGLYGVETTAGTLQATWVLDSACNVAPTFPSPQAPSTTVSGAGIRVVADRPTFDPTTAILFDPIDDHTFAYILPLSPIEALVESASFGSVARIDQTLLIDHLAHRHPLARFTVTHTETGIIPLGFAPTRTAGRGHILLGTKRGLVKPSAGYGVVRIARETDDLARRWHENRPLPLSRRAAWRWRMVDRQFLRLATHGARGPLALLDRTMGAIPVADSLRLLDEDLPLRQLIELLRLAAPGLIGRGV